MKLLRYGPKGREKPGLLDAEGRIRDLSGQLVDLSPEAISPEGLAALSRLDVGRLPVVEGKPRLGVPVAGIGKFVAIGLNYAEHAEEANLPFPKEPVIFLKAITSLNGPDDTVVLPLEAAKVDWEVELGIVIGRRASYVPERDALNYVAGYCVVNDVSEREYQLERGGTWDKGKGCDTFGPVGPWLVTADEVGNPQDLDLWLEVNGRRMQTGNTRTMIFSCATIISYVSRYMTLMPGDIITTGTPPGVGMGMKPDPVFLKPGDIVALGITKLGAQHQSIVAWHAESTDISGD
ncbi:fumarylacetoacetate hydrolase family protein [Xanthobacter autotrophicus]|uniref:fumarylacetoacetate hydrolase family protein n=1 Tax=Xanthobacter autotrophicus TaxID=280 RepID=UPI001E2CE785|nr:fumarylacetoacetate hydrolase family protein [Xanthobacter autotrophicus]UDQ90043.1 fumarylacetoacetate hydrolase family protein [Xanthobacter autotrophicus]